MSGSLAKVKLVSETLKQQCFCLTGGQYLETIKWIHSNRNGDWYVLQQGTTHVSRLRTKLLRFNLHKNIANCGQCQHKFICLADPKAERIYEAPDEHEDSRNQ